MPIDFAIDHDRRLVTARGRGVLTADELFAYQREVWLCPDVAGYDELVDMSNVEQIVAPTPHGVAMLARESAAMDDPTRRSKFAVVAPQDLAYGLGRMYQTHRSLESNSTKDVRVFRTMREALEYLGVKNH
jgi:hypothetical protein